ncbi:MAG TPA: hypothetical protein VKM36_07285, partial [Balneolaceae bacterium]|nr:hypothetical protein [Balneolaceae bacterium]
GDLGLDNYGSKEMLTTVNGALNDLGKAMIDLKKVQDDLKNESLIELCVEYREKIIPAMGKIRDSVDYLERYTADDY